MMTVEESGEGALGPIDLFRQERGLREIQNRSWQIVM